MPDPEEKKIVNQAGMPYVAGPRRIDFPMPSQTPSLNDVLSKGQALRPPGFDDRGQAAIDAYNKRTTVDANAPYLSEVSKDLTGRYDRVTPWANNEDIYGQNQTFGSKMVSGVGKGLLLTGTTFLQTTAGLVNGIGKAVKDGKASSFYDNDFNRQLDEINKRAEDLLPNYYTDKEKNAHWYSSDKIMTGNFLWDGIVKNLGFAAGAALAGGTIAAGLKSIPLTSRLFSVGKGAEALLATEEGLLGANKVADTYGKVKKLSDQFLKSYDRLTTGGRALVAGISTTGEAGMEAYQNLNEFRNNRIQEYKDSHGGEAPTGLILDEINDIAEKVGNRTFALNVALLSTTNYIQFPKILGSSYKAEKGLLTSLESQVNPIIKDTAGKWTIKGAQSRVGKVLSGIQSGGGYLFSGSEAFEEGAQFAISTGTKDFYDKKLNGVENGVVDSIYNSIKETFGTDEGMENILIGGLSGAIMLAKGRYQERNTKEKNTNELVNALNKNGFSDFTKATLDSVVRGVSIQEERENLLKIGDKFGSKNSEADYTINYLLPRIKYGRMDLVKADIQDYTMLASTEEGFNELVKEGKVTEGDNRLAYLNRLSNLSQVAESMESLYQSINLRYGSQVDVEGKRLYTDAVMEKMMYSGSKIDDLSKRIMETMSQVPGIDVDTVLNDVVSGNDTEFNKAIAELETNKVLTPEKITDAQEALTDMSKMALHRNMYIKEYQEFRANPKNNQDAEPILRDEDGNVIDKEGKIIPTVNLITADGEENLEIGTEYFLGRNVHKDKSGKDVYHFPVLTILGENEDGTIRIKDKNGAERNVSKKVLEAYKLGKVSDTLNNKKAKFYLDNINTPYYFNFGKNKGGSKIGRLEYNSKKGILDFVYKNEKGGIKVIEVTGDQFVPKKGFNKPMITPGAPLTIAQQKSLDGFTKEKDVRIAEKNKDRLKILDELLTNLDKQHTKTISLIESKTASLLSIKEELKELEEEISKGEVDKRITKTVQFKKATKIALTAATKLSDTYRQIEDEIEVLKTEQEEIEITQAHVEELVKDVELYPSETSLFLKELNSEIDTLTYLHLENSKALSQLEKLSKSVSKALNSALDLIGSMISNFEKKYPNVPRVIGQDWIDFLKTNPNFLRLKPNYKQDLAFIDDAIANIEDESITVNETRLNAINDHIDVINGELKELENSIKAKQTILDTFNGIMKVYRESKKQNEVLKKEGQVQDDLSNSLIDTVQTSEAYEDHEDYEFNSKKNDLAVVLSTVASTEALESDVPYAKRALRFGNRFYDIVKKTPVRGMLVTLSNEIHVLPGLLAHLYPNVSQATYEDMIIMVVTNDKGELLDENGDVIPEDTSDVLDRAIYQTFPGEKLVQKYPGGFSSMFRDSTDVNEVKRLTKLYKEWRKGVLSDANKGVPRNIVASFGFPDYVKILNEEGNYVEDTNARVSVKDAGLIDNETLESEHVITVTTSSDTITNGSSTLKVGLGMVYLNMPGKLIKLRNRKFTTNEVSVIFDAIHQLTKNAQEIGGLKTDSSDRLFSWLRSTIYWGIARNMQTGERKEKAGKSNVWFEANPETNEQELHVGEATFPFTPDSLKLNKQVIISLLLDMYNNTNNTLTKEPLTKAYYEAIGIDENGELINKKWPNYQAYLLSDKSPDSSGNLTMARKTEDIPLVTNVRPLEGSDDFNRNGIYFTLSDTPDDYIKKEEVKKEPVTVITPSGKKESTPTFVLDGQTPNIMNIGKLGQLEFIIDKVKAGKILTEMGVDVFAPGNEALLQNFITKLVDEEGLVVEDLDKRTIDNFIKSEVILESQKENKIDKSVEDATNALAVATVYMVKQLKGLLAREVIQKENEETPDPGKKPQTRRTPTIVKKEEGKYKVNGESNNFVYTGETGGAKVTIPFTIDGEKVSEIIKKEPSVLTDSVKKASFITGLVQSKIITIGFTEDTFNEVGDLYPEESDEEIFTRVLNKILDDVLPQLTSNTVENTEEAEEVVESPEVKVSPEAVISEVEPIKKDIDETTTIIPVGPNQIDEDDEVYSLILDEENEFLEEENWNRISEDLMKMVPQLPVFRTKNVIQATNGRQAWGMFRQGAIYIYKNAEAGTAYHEVFEAIWGMFTDQKERNKLLEEFRSRGGEFREHSSMRVIKRSEATNSEIKEEMAEEFRQFILDKNKKEDSKEKKSLLRKLFDDMVAFFKAFLFGENSLSNANELFKKIGNGYYSQFNRYEGALSLAQRGILDIEDATVDSYTEFRLIGIRAKQEHELFQHMTYTAIESLLKNKKSMFSVTTKLKGSALYDELYKNILGDEVNQIPGILDKKVATLDRNSTNGSDKNLIAKKTDEILQLKKAIKLNWPDIVTRHKQYLAPYEITFDSEDDAVIMDENNNGKGDAHDSNKIDSFKKANAVVKMLFATIPDTIRKEVPGGGTKIARKPSSINGVTFVGTDKVFITVMNKLHGSRNMTDMLNKLKEMANSTDPFADSYSTIYKRLTKLSPLSPESFDKQNLDQNDLRLLSGFWKTVKKQNPDVLTVFELPGGETQVGDSSLTNAAKQSKYEMIQHIISTIREGKSKYFTYSNGVFNPTKSLMNLVIDPSDAKFSSSFLKEFGIDINSDTIESWKNGPKDKTRSLFIKSTEGLLLGLKSMKDIEYLKQKSLDSENHLLNLGTINAIINNPIFESTYYNLAGEKVQSFIGTNYASVLYDYLSSSTKLSDLENTPFKYFFTDVFTMNQGSVILNKIFTKGGLRIANTDNIMKPVYINGTIDDEGNERIETSKLTYKGRLAQEINLNLDGVYMNLVPGDAELEWGLRLHEKNSPFVTKDDVHNKDYQNIFRKYFISEVLLSRNNRIVAKGRTATDLRFFKGILGEELHKDIVKYKTKNAKGSDENEKAEALYDIFESRIKSAVEAFINKDAHETKFLLEQYHLITPTAEGYNTSLGFSSNNLSESVLNLEIKQLSINYMIANIEIHKLLYSDPYQYSDELKRIKNYNSPRQSLADSQEINSAIHTIYNEGYEEEDTGWFDMDRDHFRTVTLSDVNSFGELEGYNKVIDAYEETDGGGYITDKANRLLKIKSSDWTESNENQYRHDMKYLDIVLRINNASNSEEKSKLEAELITLEKENPEIKNTYTPTKPIVSGGKENGRNYNDQILDKYALFPLSFRLLHKMNPDSNAVKLYLKMLNEEIDYAVYSTGRKVGVELIHDLYDKEGNFNETPFQSKEELEGKVKGKLGMTKIPFSIMGIQSEVPSKDKALVTQGSQITKLVTLDFMQSGVPIDYVDENVNSENFDEVFISWMKLSDEQKKEKSPLYKEIRYNQELLEAKIEKGYNSLLKSLGITSTSDGFIVSKENRKKLIDTLEGEITKQEVNNNLLEAFESFRDEENEVILEATPVYQQVRNILYSIANREVVSPKISGGMKVQIPSTLLEDGSRIVLSTDSKGKSYYKSDNLKFYSKGEDKTNVCEIMVARWFKSDMSDKDLLEYFNTTKEGQEILKGVAFRTPTQKQNSIDAFVIKEFLPYEYGDAVVVPSALVKKAGSDFDIDKLSIYLKNLLVNSKGQLVLNKFLSRENSTVEERYIKWVNDQASKDIKSYIKFLSKEEVTKLREKFKNSFDTFSKLYQDTKSDLMQENYNLYSETLRESKSNVYAEQDSLMKTLFSYGKKVFVELSKESKEKFFEVKEQLRLDDINGPEEINRYLSLSIAMLESESLSMTDRDNLETMKSLYIKELEVLGATEEVINKFVKETTEIFRNKKGDIVKTLNETIGAQQREYNIAVSSEKGAIALDKAKQMASLSSMPTIEEFDNLSIFEQNTDKAIENEYISSLANLITHPLNFDNLVKPNSADELKDLVRKDLNVRLGIKEIDYSSPEFMLSRSNMSGLRRDFVKGKRAIGIAAVGQTNHSQNQRTPIFIDNSKITLDNFSEKDIKLLGDGLIKFSSDKYNTITINGRTMPSLSGIKNKANKYISDIIGMFIDGYVDIAKGPWIMQLGATPDTAGTWLFLLKLGIPVKDVTYFMNQPIIRDLLKESETTGISMFNEDLIDDVSSKFPGKLDKNQEIPDTNTLGNMIRKSGESLTADQNSKQLFLLKEFLKYSKLATQLYLVTQGTNMDTAFVNDPLLIFKKNEQLKLARKTILSSVELGDNDTLNIINAADSILNNSFVGTLNKIVNEIREAMTPVLISDRTKLRNVLEKVLLPYIQKYDRDFIVISQKVVSNFFDWAVQVDRGFNKTISKVLLGNQSEKSAAQQIIEFKNSVVNDPSHELYDNKVLESMLLVSGGKDKVADNIQLVGKDNKVYEQNQIINSFEEIKDYLVKEGKADIYGKIVRLAVMQSGLTNSKISYSKLLPYVDFQTIYSKTLSQLENHSTLDVNNFAELYAFQRNQWSNKDIVPIVEMRAEYDLLNRRQPSKLERNVPNQLKKAMANKLIPKVIVRSGGGPDIIRVVSQEKLTPEQRKIVARTGSRDHFKSQLMRKVYRDEARTEPLVHEIKIKGRETPIIKEVYVAINAWGDSFRAMEFYDYQVVDNNGKPERVVPASIFDNGTAKVELSYDINGNKLSSPEVTDDVIVALYENGRVVPSVSDVIPIVEPTENSPINKILNKESEPTRKSRRQYKKLNIDNVTLSPEGIITIEGVEYNKKINFSFLEGLGYSPNDIGEILKKIIC